jgi:hypothetical protein
MNSTPILYEVIIAGGALAGLAIVLLVPARTDRRTPYR